MDFPEFVMVIIIYTLIIICFHIMKTYKACIVIILFFFAFLLIAIRIHNRKFETSNCVGSYTAS